jgi:probable HAF family extracellular repeat protein
MLAEAAIAERDRARGGARPAPLLEHQMVRPRRPSALLLSTLIAFPALASDPATFTPLGDVAPGDTSSAAGAVSSDGLVVTGRCTPEGSQRVFRWTQAGGMVNLNGPNLAMGVGASADGSVLVCNSATLGGDSVAHRWTNATGFVPLPGLTTSSPGPRVFAVTADGETAVGESNTPLVSTAVVWTSSGVVPLSNEPGFSSFSARGVSADGLVVVGGGSSGPLGAVAFKWSQTSGMGVLQDLTGGSTFARANAVSGDGLTIAGFGSTDDGQEAAYWTGSFPTSLGDLPGGAVDSSALAISASGKVIVGYATTDLGQEAFVWDQDKGMRGLKQALESAGVTSLTGWTLTRAVGISASGEIIVGYGINPDGRTEAWLARLPVSCYPNCDGSTNDPVLTANDFLCFINNFVTNQPYANCDNSVSIPILNINDFQCFINRFSEGCL